MADLNPFNDVPTIQEPNSIQEVGGQSVLSAVGGLNIGAGGQSINADPYSGFWVGAKTFAEAPFSVDLNGNIVASTLNLSNYISKTGTSQYLSGSIIIRDGTTPAIFIGILTT